jgi:hypothetical protein
MRVMSKRKGKKKRKRKRRRDLRGAGARRDYSPARGWTTCKKASGASRLVTRTACILRPRLGDLQVARGIGGSDVASPHACWPAHPPRLAECNRTISRTAEMADRVLQRCGRKHGCPPEYAASPAGGLTHSHSLATPPSPDSAPPPAVKHGRAVAGAMRAGSGFCSPQWTHAVTCAGRHEGG